MFKNLLSALSVLMLCASPSLSFAPGFYIDSKISEPAAQFSAHAVSDILSPADAIMWCRSWDKVLLVRKPASNAGTAALLDVPNSEFNAVRRVVSERNAIERIDDCMDDKTDHSKQSDKKPQPISCLTVEQCLEQLKNSAQDQLLVVVIGKVNPKQPNDLTRLSEPEEFSDKLRPLLKSTPFKRVVVLTFLERSGGFYVFSDTKW